MRKAQACHLNVILSARSQTQAFAKQAPLRVAGPSRASLCSAGGWVGRSRAHFRVRAVELVPVRQKFRRRP
jgi:hypothetical protein